MLRRPRAALARFASAVFVLLLAALPASAAAPTTPKPGAVIRLVAAGIVDGRAEVGLEIALEPGWKTYWRTPGDAGIPPVVEWSRSTGVKSLEVRFPAPVRFGEEGARSIGYTAPVILPLDLVAADPSRPISLDLDVQLGLCRDICVPVSARLAATLTPGAPVDEVARARLAEARKALPQPAVKGIAPWVISLERDRDSVPGALLVKVKMIPDDGTDDRCDVIVEGPTSDWALPLPEKVAESGDREIWRFDLDGLPHGARLEGTELRFTMRARDRVVEQRVTLDASLGAP